MQRREARAPLARLVNLGVAAGHERFEMTSCFRFGGKRGDPRQVRRGALVELMKARELFKRQLKVRLALETVQNFLQFRPVGPSGGDEALEVNDHARGMDSWMGG